MDVLEKTDDGWPVYERECTSDTTTSVVFTSHRGRRTTGRIENDVQKDSGIRQRTAQALEDTLHKMIPLMYREVGFGSVLVQ